MKKATLILVALWALALPVKAQSDDLPEYSFLWNNFSSFREVDGFAIATTDFGLAVLQYDPLTEQYHQVGQLMTNTAPFTSKLSGDVLAVQTWADIVYFVDVSDLPNLTLLGEADLAYPFYDFALKDQSLYVAAGFDGLLRYQLTNYNDPVLVDSNLSGVHYVQVDIFDDELLALDDYNAVLRYDLSAPGFGDFVDYFWLPLQARCFARLDSTLIFPLNGRSKAFIGHYGASGPVITDTIALYIKPQVAMAVDTHFVLLSSQAKLMQTVSRQSHSTLLVALPPDVEPYLDGVAFTRDNVNHLIVPSQVGGLYQFDLDGLDDSDNNPREVYNRPGPVVDVHLGGGKLVTAGRNNPFEVYSLHPGGAPTIDTTLYGLNDVGSIAKAGNVYLVYYPQAGSVLVVSVQDGTIEIINSISVGTSSLPKDIQFYDTDPIDSLDVMLVLWGGRIDLYAVSSTWEVMRDTTFQADGAILDAIVVDSFLVFSSANDQLHGYKILSNLRLVWWWTKSTPEPLQHLVATGPRIAPDGSPLPELLLGFSGSEMYTIDIPGVDVPTIELTQTYDMDVRASALFDNALYTVGDLGLGRLDLAYDPPVLVDQWGYPGNRIAVDSNTIVITDGSGVHLYPMPVGVGGFSEPDEPGVSESQSGLGQNYPNPFNPRTTIDYSLAEPARVRITILNVLGQTIATLVDDEISSGYHSVTWDGVDDLGERVASGVYFYRLTTPNRVETRKMVVLK